MEQLHISSNLEISFDTEANILFCNWIGLQTEEALKKSGGIIHKLLKKHKCTKILNDNTLVQGLWYHSATWTANEWFPLMIDAGLTHFAWVCSKDIFAQLSAKRALPESGVVRIFYLREAALEWLMSIK